MSTSTRFGTKVISSGTSQQESFVFQLPDNGTPEARHVGIGA